MKCLLKVNQALLEYFWNTELKTKYKYYIRLVLLMVVYILIGVWFVSYTQSVDYSTLLNYQVLILRYAAVFALMTFPPYMLFKTRRLCNNPQALKEFKNIIKGSGEHDGNN